MINNELKERNQHEDEKDNQYSIGNYNVAYDTNAGSFCRGTARGDRGCKYRDEI